MFLCKKIVSQLLNPLPLVLLPLLLGLVLLWFTRRQRAGKILVGLGAGLLLLCSYSFFPDLALRGLEQEYPPVLAKSPGPAGFKAVQPAQFIVVLGGGHNSDPRLPVASQLSSESLIRTLEGIRLYRAGLGGKLVFSGGGGYDPVPEAETMSRLALLLGVDPQDILLESTSLDTEEQARLLKPLLAGTRFFLVTSASHLPRSMALFRKQGLDPAPAPAGHRVRQAANWSPGDFFPGGGGLVHLEIAVHEYLGLAWAWLRGAI